MYMSSEKCYHMEPCDGAMRLRHSPGMWLSHDIQEGLVFPYEYLKMENVWVRKIIWELDWLLLFGMLFLKVLILNDHKIPSLKVYNSIFHNLFRMAIINQFQNIPKSPSVITPNCILSFPVFTYTILCQSRLLPTFLLHLFAYIIHFLENTIIA